MPRASIIIVTYNSAAQIQRCLKAVAAQDYRDFEVVVIDNASTDGTVDAITLPDSRFTLLRNADNTGFAAANNQGAAATDGEFIVTLNPDAYPETDWLGRLVAAADRFPAVSFGSTQISAADPGRYDGLGDTYWIGGLYWRGAYGHSVARTRPPPVAEVFSVCAAAALYRRCAFMAVGGFDEDFFCYGEDVDLGFRLRLFGETAMQVGDARVLHEGYASSARYSAFASYFGTRNRIRVWLKNMPAAILIATLPLFLISQAGMVIRDLCLFRPSSLKGAAAAIGGMRSILRQRTRVQSARQVGVLQIIRPMAISPHLLIARAPVSRPVDQSAP